MGPNHQDRLYQSAGLPACLIGRCCSCFCSWFVLVSVLGLCLFLCSLAARVCFAWIKVTPPHYYYHYYYHSYSYSYAYSDAYSDSSIPLLLPPFFPTYYTGSAGSSWHCLQHYRRLQLLVTGRTRYWSTRTHLVCVPLVVPARTCYSSCFWFTALSSSLLLSGFHVACTSTSLWGNLSPLSPSMQRSAVKTEAHT